MVCMFLQEYGSAANTKSDVSDADSMGNSPVKKKSRHEVKYGLLYFKSRSFFFIRLLESVMFTLHFSFKLGYT